MTSILAFVVVLGVLIFVHELGHFLTAKAAGIAVPRFSIGLGPRVWGFKAGETEYVISALPLGGYVKMAGMGEEEVLERLEGGASDLQTPPQRRFDNKPLATRAIVISAGVIMNFLFAIIAFAAIAYRQSWPPVIAEVEPGRPAEERGRSAARRSDPGGGWQRDRIVVGVLTLRIRAAGEDGGASAATRRSPDRGGEPDRLRYPDLGDGAVRHDRAG